MSSVSNSHSIWCLEVLIPKHDQFQLNPQFTFFFCINTSVLNTLSLLFYFLFIYIFFNQYKSFGGRGSIIYWYLLMYDLHQMFYCIVNMLSTLNRLFIYLFSFVERKKKKTKEWAFFMQAFHFVHWFRLAWANYHINISLAIMHNV